MIQLIELKSFTSTPLPTRSDDDDLFCGVGALSKALGFLSILSHSFEIYTIRDQSFFIFSSRCNRREKDGEANKNPNVAKNILTLYDALLASVDICRDTLAHLKL